MSPLQSSVGNKKFDDIQGFIEDYSLKFSAHVGQLMMLVTRVDDDGFRGGPGSCSTFDFRVTSLSTQYEIGLIDHNRKLSYEAPQIYFPIARAINVYCHGLNATEHKVCAVACYDLLRMSQTLSWIHPEKGTMNLPMLEILVGDDAVNQALENVEHEREVLAICNAAKKLGRPIHGSDTADKICAGKTTELVQALVRTTFGERQKISPKDPTVAIAIAELKKLGFSDAQITEKCLAMLASELTEALGSPTKK